MLSPEVLYLYVIKLRDGKHKISNQWKVPSSPEAQQFWPWNKYKFFRPLITRINTINGITDKGGTFQHFNKLKQASPVPGGRARSKALVGVAVRIPPGGVDVCVLWLVCCQEEVCCECCVLSGRGLWDGLITRPEESYGCLSVVSALCCQVEVSATGWSLVQRSPMDVCLLWVLCVVV